MAQSKPKTSNSRTSKRPETLNEIVALQKELRETKLDLGRIDRQAQRYYSRAIRAEEAVRVLAERLTDAEERASYAPSTEIPF